MSVIEWLLQGQRLRTLDRWAVRLLFLFLLLLGLLQWLRPPSLN
jgi:hypothetical protein